MNKSRVVSMQFSLSTHLTLEAIFTLIFFFFCLTSVEDPSILPTINNEDA